jgi:hypothetical protein
MTYSATTILARRGASAIKSAMLIKSAILIRAISRMTAKDNCLALPAATKTKDIYSQ